MRQATMLRTRTPALVALVALSAMLLVHVALRSNDLSPWKGGGFAMFSTVDSPGLRTVAVWAEVSGVDERVDLVGAWEDARRDLRALPTATRTAALADRVASSTLVRRADGSLSVATTSPEAVLLPSGGTTTSAGPSAVAESVTHTAVEASRVRVDVSKLSYDEGVVHSTLLRSASVDVAYAGGR